MSLLLVTGLLFAAMNLRSVETAEDGISKSWAPDIWTICEMALSLQTDVFPGTKWCGDVVAKGYQDLGTSEQTDICCREHAECGTFIQPDHTMYGLTNTAKYTVSGCDCDQLLMECLVNTTEAESVPEDDKQTAKAFGNIFFNVISIKCLEQEYPLVCVEKGSEGRCNQCESDTNETKVWTLVKRPAFPL